MKIEHRFSFFIFQLAEKMNDPNIHAFRREDGGESVVGLRN